MKNAEIRGRGGPGPPKGVFEKNLKGLHVMKKGGNLCLTSVFFSSEIHFQFLGFGPGLFCGSEAWSRRLACSACGGRRNLLLFSTLVRRLGLFFIT